MTGTCHGPRAVYYSLNNRRKYIDFAKRSVASLRKFNKNISVHLFIYGAADSCDTGFFSRHGVRIHKRREQRRIMPTFLKWLSLPELSEENILFCDADTVFYRDPAVLFDRFNEKDFYARREFGTSWPAFEAEKTMTCYQLKDERFSRLLKMLSLRRMPVFNSGVMLFNRGSHKKFSFKEFFFYYMLFNSLRIPYPAVNSHIMDEIVASLVMGGLASLRYGFLDKAAVPLYREIKLKITKGFGIVTHVGSLDYRDYLKHGSA